MQCCSHSLSRHHCAPHSARALTAPHSPESPQPHTHPHTHTQAGQPSSSVATPARPQRISCSCSSHGRRHRTPTVLPRQGRRIGHSLVFFDQSAALLRVHPRRPPLRRETSLGELRMPSPPCSPSSCASTRSSLTRTERVCCELVARLYPSCCRASHSGVTCSGQRE